MPQEEIKGQRINPWVLGARILVGLTLVVAGSGKMAGQTEFFDALLRSFWTPAVARFISDYLPWLEIALGGFLLLGLFPRPASALCLPITMGFIANNIWALWHGVENFGECSCFGWWEKWLGTISPLQALCIDIVLFGLALLVLLYHPHRFFSPPAWFSKRKRKA